MGKTRLWNDSGESFIINLWWREWINDIPVIVLARFYIWGK